MSIPDLIFYLAWSQDTRDAEPSHVNGVIQPQAHVTNLQEKPEAGADMNVKPLA